MRGFKRQHTFTLIRVFAMVFSAYPQGVNLKVNCDRYASFSTIKAALKRLSPEESNTITVSGICNENVLIHDSEVR